MRTTPLVDIEDSLARVDMMIQDTFFKITECEPDEIVRSRLRLKFSDGGASLRSTLEHADPAYISSFSASRAMVKEIAGVAYTEGFDLAVSRFNNFVAAEDQFEVQAEIDGVTYDNVAIQKELSMAVDKVAENDLLSEDQYRPGSKARVLLDSSSGKYCLESLFKALPSKGLGTLIPNTVFQTILKRIFRIPLLKKRVPCPYPSCSQVVDLYGDHIALCSHGKDKKVAHQEIAAVIDEGRKLAGYGGRTEPVGLFPNNGKKPDGIFINYYRNQDMIYDITCVSPLAKYGKGFVGSEVERAAKNAYDGKITKYGDLASLAGLVFYPLAFELGGRMDERSLFVVTDIAARISYERGSHPDYETGLLMRKLQKALHSATAGVLVRRLNLRPNREYHQ